MQTEINTILPKMQWAAEPPPPVFMRTSSGIDYAERDRFMETLRGTAELCVGFDIDDHLDAQRIYESVHRVLESTSQEPTRDRVIALLGLEAAC